MARLQWREEYSVGDAEIDRQHRNLFALIDRLEDQDLDASAVAVTLEKLELYVKEHFSDEEAKLKACNYDDMEPHIRQHEEFHQWLQQAKDSLKASPGSAIALGHNIHDFLRDWLLSHIMKSDQAYKDWLVKQ